MAPRNTTLTIKQKLLLISLLQKKEKTKHELAVEFKCNISTINRIIRNEAKIREVADSNKNVELKRYRKSSHADVDKALTTWFNQMRLNNVAVSSKMAMNKAKEFAIRLNSDFEPNNGWLWRWQRRENIKFTKIHGERNEHNPKTMAPRKTTLTIKQKLLLISLLQKKEKTKHQLAVEFKCDMSTISRIIKNEAKIREVAESNKNVELKRYRKSSHADVDKALTIWFNQMRLNNVAVSSKIAMNKAKEFAIRLNSDFKPNSGWLWRWQRRENIKFTNVHGDSNEHDPLEIDQHFQESSNVASILQNYTPDNIFNADESGLFYKVLPSETLAPKQSQKQRLTLLFICNSTGTYKKVYTIGKCRNPGCFNGNNNLPVPYFSNENAWMKNSLWMSILQDIDQEMVNQNRKIVLFVDNASCHKITGDLQNINVQFLTALVQPLEQGIIHYFKSNYRQIMIRKQMVSLEKGLQLQDFIKSITLLDALYFVKRAWWLVTENTIINCFRKAGFSAHEQLVDEAHENLFDITPGLYNFDEYVTCDQNLQCYGLLTDDQIIDGLSDDNAENLSEDEVVTKEELIMPSFKDALLAIDVLRQYFKYRNYEEDEVENLETIIFNNEIIP